MRDAAGAARRAAERWGLPAPALVRTGMNAIFVAGDVVLRVGTSAGDGIWGRGPEDQIELAELLTSAGVRVAAPMRDEPVVDGDRVVTAWARLEAVGAEPDWRDVGRMVAIVHALDGVPGPLPRGEDFPWWQFDALLDELGDLVDGPAMTGLRATVERHRGWHDGVHRVVCHGDVHPGNVLMTASGAALLDWDLLCLAPPGWDHAMLLRLPRWGWPARWYDDFADGYGRSLAADPVAVALADLRLVAATLMRLRAARDDPSAMPQAQLRLAYWRGDPDAPPWTPV